MVRRRKCSMSFAPLAVALVAAIIFFVIVVIEMMIDQNFLLEMKASSFVIDNLSKLLTAVASVAVVVTLMVAIAQLQRSADQLRQSSNHARAQAIYTALKDVRELPATASMGDRFNLYYALFEQKRLGVWDEQMWGPVSDDIRMTFADAVIGPTASAYWTNNKSNYTTDFQNCVEKIIAP